MGRSRSRAAMESFVVESLAKKCGCIMGAGDQAPLAIEQLGCAVTLLTPESLLDRDLSEFDPIVFGVRAYNVRADVIANQDRLMAYVDRCARRGFFARILVLQLSRTTEAPDVVRLGVEVVDVVLTVAVGDVDIAIRSDREVGSRYSYADEYKPLMNGACITQTTSPLSVVLRT
ncbi:MAG: hypothetical protein ABIZ80_18115 [Bryobacteraceae bacterium]